MIFCLVLITTMHAVTRRNEKGDGVPPLQRRYGVYTSTITSMRLAIPYPLTLNLKRKMRKRVPWVFDTPNRVLFGWKGISQHLYTFSNIRVSLLSWPSAIHVSVTTEPAGSFFPLKPRRFRF